MTSSTRLPRSPTRSSSSPGSRFALGLALGLVLAPLRAAPAQEQALVEGLAQVLSLEDARDYQAGPFARALADPEPLVRRTAATALGRIGDHRGTPALLPLLLDTDSTVRVAAAFALGLLRDTSAVPALLARLTGPQPLDAATGQEIVSALARSRVPRGAELLRAILRGEQTLAVVDTAALVRQALLEAWRLGPLAPASDLLAYADVRDDDRRYRAMYSLARLRSPLAAERILRALDDPLPSLRAIGARALTASYVDTSGLARATVMPALFRALSDPDATVRVLALRSLETFHDSTSTKWVLTLLSDPDLNVQVEAAAALGASGGTMAVPELARLAAGKGATFALRREALLALASLDTTAFRASAASWTRRADWRERAAAAEGGVRIAPGRWPGVDPLTDKDARVVAVTLQGWAEAATGPDPALVAAARARLSHADAAVRSVAADIVSRAPDVADVPTLAAAYRLATRDSFPEAAQSALGALAAISASSAAGRSAVDRGFLADVPRPADYLLRRWAELNWPDAAVRWGPAFPLVTGRTFADYREIAARYLVPTSPERNPHVLVETEQRGTLEIELFGPEAPLTVENFLRLTDQEFFDRHRWHRVVPGFVIQDGDPRGDGWGGPGGAIRDEINRVRYAARIVGMALSGPDTGSSQWFITLTPQPHLDGAYTVFGRLVGSIAALPRITQGDQIRTIRRAPPRTGG